MDHEPQSELARYAFGFSDKKPSRVFWIIQGVMVAVITLAIFGVI